MVRTLRFLLIGLLLFWAPAAGAAALSAQDQGDLRRIEDYLNGVKTMTAKFIQVAPSGRQLTGTFYLSRPGKMRLEYDPPIKDFIVSDGWFIFYWDGEMRQQSSMPIGSSLADIILRDNLKLSGDVTVDQVERFPGALEVTVHATDDPGQGRITLVFQDRPLSLHQWRVVDPTGKTTTVGLLNPRFGMEFERKTFMFLPPGKND